MTVLQGAALRGARPRTAHEGPHGPARVAAARRRARPHRHGQDSHCGHQDVEAVHHHGEENERGGGQVGLRHAVQHASRLSYAQAQAESTACTHLCGQRTAQHHGANDLRCDALKNVCPAQ